MTYTFTETELQGVIASRLIIAKSKRPELAGLGYGTDVGSLPYDKWLALADLVLSEHTSMGPQDEPDAGSLLHLNQDLHVATGVSEHLPLAALLNLAAAQQTYPFWSR